MKKKIFVIVSMMVIFTLASCAFESSQNNENLQGTWTLESVSVDGIMVDLTVDSSAMLPYDYTFTFLDNEKAVADVMGVKYSTTYHVTNGIITFSDAALGALRLIVDDGTLLMKNDITRTTLTFTK